jgi:hypothetical protein
MQLHFLQEATPRSEPPTCDPNSRALTNYTTPLTWGERHAIKFTNTLYVVMTHGVFDLAPESLMSSSRFALLLTQHVHLFQLLFVNNFSYIQCFPQVYARSERYCFLSLLRLFDIIKASCRIPCTFGWTRSQTSSSLCEDNGTCLNRKCLCVRVRAGRVPFTESEENKSTKRSCKSGRSWKKYFWNSFYFTVIPLTITNLVTICQTIVSTSSSGIGSWHDSSRQRMHIPNVYNITDNIANN